MKLFTSMGPNPRVVHIFLAETKMLRTLGVLHGPTNATMSQLRSEKQYFASVV